MVSIYASSPAPPLRKMATIWSLVVLFEAFFRAIARIKEITASTQHMQFRVVCPWIPSLRDPFSETIGGDTWVANTKTRRVRTLKK